MGEELYFVITVDAEADDAGRNQDRIGLQNMSAIPRFQALCEAYDIVPTYLVTYECAVREEALTVLKPISDQGRCEIGYHFHSWTTPPFEQSSPEGIDLKWQYAYQYELPESLFREKAECLFKTIKRAYGLRPTAHRAGRWGIDQRTVDWLIEHDFMVDTSVVPLWNLTAAPGRSAGGPSFLSSPRAPFYWRHSVQDNSNPDGLVEMPLTVYAPRSLLPALLAAYLGKHSAPIKTASRIYQKLIGGNGSLRPNPAYAEGLVQNIILSNLRRQPAIINMMIRSSELMLGQSPFSRTEADCTKMWNRLRQSFALIRRYGIASLGISASAVRVEESVTLHERPDFTPRLARWRPSGGLFQEAPRQVLDAGRPAPCRNATG
jgi:hypothetical protein